VREGKVVVVAEKVVLVTGSSSGFGWLASVELARRGHRVFATMRDVQGRNQSASNELMNLADSEGIALSVLELDVTDTESVDAAVAVAIKEAGRVDVAVNNAGFGYFGYNEGFTVEQVQRLYDTLVFGTFRVDRAVLPHMRAQGSGLLVHVSSVVGRVLWPFTGIYASAKHAVEALAQSFRYDLAPAGVDSVIVQPGAYPTKMNQPENVVHGADAERLETYGELAGVPAAMQAAMASALEGSVAPDPAEVATAIADLIERPASSRPLRTVIGADAAPAAPINEAADAIHKAVYEQFGIAHMLSVRAEN
jgi:NAD(P)-dependent dehydrogenase (short-subunit alcohol dehydrogenase family)